MSYYTPTIEELHVGMHCEWLRDPGNEIYIPIELTANMLSLTLNTTGCNFEKMDVPGPISYRVKYLDREDIESLGFNKTFKNEFGIEYLFYENKDYQYCLYQSLNEVLIFRADKNISWFSRPSFSDAYRPIFSGIIKNKSELERVLKQVGVL